MLPELANQHYTEWQIRKKRDKIDELIRKVKDPNFDSSKMSPEEYVVLKDYEPEIAQLVEEKAPELVRAASEGAVRGREAQMAALDRYRNLSQMGEDTQSRILGERALLDAAAMNRGSQQAIQDSFARRGMAGSGNELVASLLAQQGAAQTGTQAAQQNAMNAMNRRLDALRQSADLGSQIRGEDVSLEAQNAAVLNDYNQRFATTKNRYNQYAADTRNQAKLGNLERAQSLANMNVENRNQANLEYLNRYNQNEGNRFKAQMDKTGERTRNIQERIRDDKQNAANRASINAQEKQTILNMIPMTMNKSGGQQSQAKMYDDDMAGQSYQSSGFYA